MSPLRRLALCSQMTKQTVLPQQQGEGRQQECDGGADSMIQWFSPMKHFNPEKYELWFEALAEQGYEPQITPLSFIAMRFEKDR